RRVQYLWNVGRTNDDDLATRNKAIHQAEKLRYHPLFHLAGHFRALGSHGIDLINKENRRRVARCFFKNLAEFGLTLAVKLPHDLRPVEVNKMHPALGCYGASQQCFSCAGWTVKQHTFWGEDAQPLEDARVLEWQLDDFANPRHFALQAADILVRNGGSTSCRLLAIHHPDVSALADDDGPRGNRAHYLKIYCLGKRRHPHHAAGDHWDAFEIFEHAIGSNGGRCSTHP